ncbi:MAG: nickel-dependent hydrogenase large subunit, partial [Deltaproteobacteria bacterium]|nr:nickel-dependent hydrogenase large subunit [Deltaproteobacteria bacterium]
MKGRKTIRVDYLARVEGEGGLTIKVRGDEVIDARLDIFEPPRFFEAFLRGRHYSEAPDITARICGICPVAYIMSSIQAMESGFGVSVSDGIRSLRKLVYFGEWIESHALHIYMLHAPDFLGYQDAIQLASDYPEVVKRGLELKRIGNHLLAVVGGREIHPINIKT